MPDATSTIRRKRFIGQTSLAVTEIGFGGASLGNLYREISELDARDAADAAWDAGMRYFDTAPYYGFGLSERRLGDALRLRPREEFVLSTKVGRLMVPVSDYRAGTSERHGFCSPMPFEPFFDYSYDGVMRSFEDSLQRTGLSRIDILLVHDIGSATHGAANEPHFDALTEGGFRALDELRSSGVVEAIGLGVNEWEICEATMEHFRFECFLLAGRYTLLEQEPLNGFFDKCAEHGASLIIGGVFNSGILATGTRARAPLYYNYAPAPSEVITTVEKIENICTGYSVSLAAAALQFPLANPIVSSVIPGIGGARMVHDAAALADESIPPDFWRELKDEGIVHPEAPVPC